MERILLGVNVAGLVAAGAFAGMGVTRPAYVQPGSTSSTSLTEFWAASSAVRTWALTGPLLAPVVRGRHPAPQLLVVAGLVQLGDSALGVWQRNPSMAIFPGMMGIVHLSSARILTD